MKPVASAEQLIVSLLALGELGLRVGCIRSCVEECPSGELAYAIDELAQQAYSGQPRAREALLAVCIFLVIDRDSQALEGLRASAHESSYFNVERLLRTGASSSPELETEVDSRALQVGTGRELTVGERRSLARRPSRQQLEKLLLDPHPLVLDLLFACPLLTELDVVRVLSRRPTTKAALLAVSKSPRWLARRHVRRTLIQNPGTPHSVSIPLISTCPRDDLSSIVKTTTLSALVRSTAHELMSRLPPIESTSFSLQ